MSLWILVAVLALCILLGQALFVILGIVAVLCWNFIANDPSTLTDVLNNSTALILSFHELEKDLIIAIPLFTLAGAIMTEGGISKKLIDVMHAVLGWLPGGLAMACILACCFFAAISGSSAVTIIAVGGMMYPALQQAGYSRRFSLGLITACGAIGTLVVPALPLVAYSVFASNAAGELVPAEDLYLAGVGPTLLAIGVLATYCVVVAVANKIPRDPFSFKTLGESLWKGFFAVLMPALLVGMLFTGLATIVETSAVAVIYAILVEGVIYRDIGLKKLFAVTVDTTRLVGSILIIMAMALAVSGFLTDQQVPALATDMMRYDRVHVTDEADYGEETITGEVVHRDDARVILVTRDDIKLWQNAQIAAQSVGLKADSIADVVALHRGAPLAEEATYESAFEDLDTLREDALIPEEEKSALATTRTALSRLATEAPFDAAAQAAVLEKAEAPEKRFVRGLSSAEGGSLNARAYAKLMSLGSRLEKGGVSAAHRRAYDTSLAQRALVSLGSREALQRGLTGTVYELRVLRNFRDTYKGALGKSDTAALTALVRARDKFEGNMTALRKMEDVEWREVAPNTIAWEAAPKVKSKLGFLLGVNLILLAVGCIMDIFSGIIVMAPLVVPMAQAYGVDLVHLGIVFAMNLEIGFATPPFGINLFISQTFFRRSLAEVFGATLPFLAMLLGVLGVVTYWEPLSMWLVR
ncbi:MAG: TRAP transporter large permease [Planctomycetota bacterium]|jgi:tripartite ATP-independent transporter DctM subunit